MISYVFVLFVVKTEASLIFSEEYNENTSFNRSKWIVEGPHCGYEHLGIHDINSVNCGLRIINGNLVLMRDIYKCLNIYAPSIRTKERFTYGRFEIRAALPRADLDYSISLEPANNSQNDKDGEIKLLYNSLNGTNYSVKFGLGDDIIVHDYSYEVEEDLHDYNTYAFEWTKTQLKWFFNERVLFTFNITKELENNYNPFDKPFKLNIILFLKQVWNPNHLLDGSAKDWCPLFIFDYIRVFQNKPGEIFYPELPQSNDLTSKDICELIMSSFRPKPGNWKLIFSDEFNDKSINENNWRVNHQVDYQENITQTQTKSTSSLVISDGALVLGIIQDLDKPIQSSSILITLKESFTYGKFVIRAAIPVGKVLKPSIYLEPLQSTEGFVSERLEIVSYTHSNGANYGINFINDQDSEVTNNNLSKSITTDSLSDFHTYVLEWTAKEILWMFDDNPLYRTRFGKEFDIFCKPFKLSISLKTIESPLPYQQIPKEGGESSSSPCSLLILDYVKVYQESINNTQDVEIPEQKLLNSSNICNHIIRINEKVSQNNPFSNQLVLIVSISSLIFITIILVIIVLNVYLFKRLKTKTKTNEEIDSNDKFYDDVREMENIYADPLQINEYEEYTDHQDYNNDTTDEKYGRYYTKITSKPTTHYVVDQVPSYVDMTPKIPQYMDMKSRRQKPINHFDSSF